MATTLILVASAITAAVLGFVVGWSVRGRRARLDSATWSYATCASFSPSTDQLSRIADGEFAAAGL